MYQIDEYVIHTTGGICQIRDIAPLEIAGSDKNKKYYQLIPVSEKGSKVFVPVDNDGTIRKIVTKDEALELIKMVPEIAELVIENDKLRESRYKEVIRKCDLYELVSVIKNLQGRRMKRIEEGKKSTATDEKYYRIAEENLYSELAFALNMNKRDVAEMVFGQVETLA